jgi:leucyl aminopeptidase
MKIEIVAGDPLNQSCQALLVGCFENDRNSPFIQDLDIRLGRKLSEICAGTDFAGKLNKAVIVHTLGLAAAERIVLVGLGKKEDLTHERLRQAAGTAVQSLRKAELVSAVSVLHQSAGSGAGWLRAAAEGHLLAGYSFDIFKTGKENKSVLDSLTLLVPDEAAREQSENEAEEARIVCEAAALARELVDMPGNIATPAFLADKAREVSNRYGIECRVLEQDDMEQNGMGALLAVARGSNQPPRFIVMEYHGGSAKERPIVLVGKGITFDSGGISLKPREGMEKMKNDMAGGAAVIGAVTAAARLGLPVNLVGLVPAAENLPGGRAYKPGDVVTSSAGKTIEIVNTDAEGRLVLCDALHFAQQFRPAALVDLATLTGACVVALGSFASGLMGTDDKLVRALKKAGETSGERVWELPVWDEYGELMKSDIADMKNAGGPYAGALSAGWFLRQFVGDVRWAHLDIAGTAWEDKGRPYLPKGATGVGVRLLVEYLRGLKN